MHEEIKEKPTDLVLTPLAETTEVTTEVTGEAIEVKIFTPKIEVQKPARQKVKFWMKNLSMD